MPTSFLFLHVWSFGDALGSHLILTHSSDSENVKNMWGAKSQTGKAHVLMPMQQCMGLELNSPGLSRCTLRIPVLPGSSPLEAMEAEPLK